MGIVLASNFDVKTNLALDSRTNKNTIEERNAIPAEVRFEGLECYVKEDGGLYRLTGGVENSNWSLIPYTDADGNLTIDGNLILNNSSTPINIKEYIDTLTAAGIHYIGTLDGTESSPGSFTPAAEIGDMYIVSTAGYINGVEVEVGDSILCHTDTEAANSGTYTSINSNWNYVQANISTMRGATSDTPGMSGIVPIPSAGSENKYLKGDGTWSSITQSDVTDLVSDLESKADKQTPGGGFAAGNNASAISGGAVGDGAYAYSGGAVGDGAYAGYGGAVGSGASTTEGGAVGYGASTEGGGAVGRETSSTLGGAVGQGASTTYGGAVGGGASSGGGGAVGQDTTTDGGGAVGYNATSEGGGAVGFKASAALGGTVGQEASALNGGAVGFKASASGGGAVGSGASTTVGGAVGQDAISGNGFAGGNAAKTVSSTDEPIDAVQLGTGTNSTAKTLQVYEYQLMDSTGNIPLDRIQSALDESGISGGQETAHTHANKDVLDGISSSDITNWNNKADKQNSNGGFVGGSSASATSGGAVGNNASATYGGAVGSGASATYGGAVGSGASANTGGAVGSGASTTTSGGAVGNNASATSGGAIGSDASTTTGGAVGWNAKTSTGFAGGYNAKTQDSSGDGIDAIQLGTGTNSTAKTLQVYDYQLMTADGNIPSDRLKNSNGGFAAGDGASTTFGGAVGLGASAASGGAVGNGASATYGGAVGLDASATYGGAVGNNAKTGNGFAGGYNAKTQTSSSVAIDAIQLGTGTNSTAKTLQIYNYRLMDSTGNIPLDRIQSALDESGISGGQETAHTHANKDVLDGISSSDITNWNNKADKQNSNGGFAAGDGATVSYGGAVGNGASATSGGAVGNGAEETNGGFAGGNGTTATYGGAVGNKASTTSGGAVGDGAKTSTGFAGGYNAKTQTSSSVAIDAIQLGTGTNSTAKTLQVYNYQLMDSIGNIPKERLKNSSGGFAAGNGASASPGGAVGNGASATIGGAVGNNAHATYGGAVGSSASATYGGAVGQGAKTSTGFAGGAGAKTQDSSGVAINAIQLGSGTNSVAETLQVYEYQLMDANGNIPKERLKNSNGGFAAGDGASTISGGAVGDGAYAVYGGAVGSGASSNTGGAVGYNAKTSTGFAGGYNAKTQTSPSVAIDAIQLGSGTNSTAKTLQVYNYRLMDASGNVPSARLTQAVNSMGSDFAESLEWLDGNPNNEDRRGLFVTLTSDENNEYNKIKLANSDDEIVGVVSSIPTVVGNSCNDNWKGKYQTDIFGKPLTQIVHHEAVYEDVEVRDKDEDGNLLKTTHNESVLVSEAYDTEEYILSSEYDPSQEYIPRLKRKEWASIGFIGQLIVVDDGTCIPGKKCKCGNNGVGTLSNDDTGYRVLSRIDNTHIKILLK